MKLSLLFLALASTPLIACAAPYSNYVATDGTVLHDVEPADALRVSAARDLSCDPANIRLFQNAHSIDGPGSSTRIRRGVRNALEMADGCGQRAVYKEDCGAMQPMLPPPASAEEGRKREWKIDSQDERACRHVLISRVSLDPKAPATKGDLAISPATNSVASE